MRNIFEINEAFRRLIEESDETNWIESAKIIIEFGESLELFNGTSAGFKRRHKNDPSIISGHAPEHGEISIEDPSDKYNEERNWWILRRGKKKEMDRIGQYKVAKYNSGWLVFHHFWKSEFSTQVSEADMPDTYHLLYCSSTLEPQSFGVQYDKPIVNWRFLYVAKKCIRRIYGLVPRGYVGFEIYARK